MFTPFNSQTWVAAARRFMRLRRRFWGFTVGFAATFACCGTPLFLAEERLNEVVRQVLGVATLFGAVGCWIGAVVTLHGLLHFHCPRCGSTFVMSWRNSFPTSRCKHCGLELAAAAMATE